MKEIKMKVGDREMCAELAKVREVTVGMNDRGHFGIVVELDYAGASQGFPLCLSEWDEKKDRAVGTAAGLDALIHILGVFGVETFDQIRGRYCFALFDDDQWNGFIRGIMATKQEGGKHFLVDDWRKEWGLAT